MRMGGVYFLSLLDNPSLLCNTFDDKGDCYDDKNNIYG